MVCMKYLVCDWDGTLYPSDLNDFEANIHALHAWCNQGNGFAIASSREIEGADDLFDQIGLKGDFIGSNGGQIRLIDGRTKIYPLDPNILSLLRNYQDRFDFTFQFMSQGKFYGSDHHHFPYIHNPSKMHIQKDHPIFDVNHILDYRITQIKILVEPNDRDGLKKILSDHFKDGNTITTSDIDMVDITGNHVNKAHGIEVIMDAYGLTKASVFVCGDGENDICMFESFPNHCVMDSAETTVKSFAKHHATSVAAALQQWMR